MAVFKNVVIYRIGADWRAPSISDLEESMALHPFKACGPTDSVSSGWVPPRGEDNGALVESVAGQLIFKLAVERKSVPASAVKAALDEKCKEIEASTGRKPGKKEKKELKEEIALTLMPRAFSKRSSHVAWLDAKNRTLVIAAGSFKASDQVVGQIVELMAEVGAIIPLAPIQTETSPTSSMATWLVEQESPANFDIDDSLELRSENKEVVRYSKHTLELPEIVQHIQQGKHPVQLAMTWNKQVSFVFTAALILKKITILDTSDIAGQEEGFDADIAIEAGTLSKLIPDLIDALGGEVEQATE